MNQGVFWRRLVMGLISWVNGFERKLVGLTNLGGCCGGCLLRGGVLEGPTGRIDGGLGWVNFFWGKGVVLVFPLPFLNLPWSNK